MLKNDLTYFKNFEVLSTQGFKVCLAIFQHYELKGWLRPSRNGKRKQMLVFLNNAHCNNGYVGNVSTQKKVNMVKLHCGC